MEVSHGFDVELTQVGDTVAADGWRSAGRLRAPLIAWLIVLSSVVAVAGYGRLLAPATIARSDDGAAVARQPVDRAVPTSVPAIAPMAELIVLSSPATANAVITSRELAVRGYLASAFPGGGATVRITLEARGNRIIDDATITPVLVFGERPTVGRHVQFEARFGLPNPRPNGRMIVQVTLLDGDGRIVDVIRRPIRVGPLVETAGA